MSAIGTEPDVQDNGTRVNVSESVDKSVFDGWRADPSNRPRNLVEWDRKHADPKQIAASVRGDDPRMRPGLRQNPVPNGNDSAGLTGSSNARCRWNDYRGQGFLQREALMLMTTNERRPAFRTLRGWAISVPHEAGAIRECEDHGWMKDSELNHRIKNTLATVQAIGSASQRHRLMGAKGRAQRVSFSRRFRDFKVVQGKNVRSAADSPSKGSIQFRGRSPC